MKYHSFYTSYFIYKKSTNTWDMVSDDAFNIEISKMKTHKFNNFVCKNCGLSLRPCDTTVTQNSTLTIGKTADPYMNYSCEEIIIKGIIE